MSVTKTTREHFYGSRVGITTPIFATFQQEIQFISYKQNKIFSESWKQFCPMTNLKIIYTFIENSLMSLSGAFLYLTFVVKQKLSQMSTIQKQ